LRRDQTSIKSPGVAHGAPMMRAFICLVAGLLPIASSLRDGIPDLRSIEAVCPGDDTFEMVTERSFV
jgi:hypothetical protein